ncbi:MULTISPECIES: hypothetical protein [unclassified Sphingomonas]|uniref:hypothetical protein n=1 Tax=unclassified Sphingomonas TaxID=196159 RepID=UPI0009ECB848|nr:MULTISPECIES: hypothetical protein [unclassified Sphingomonas]MBD8736821.1 hypothetical protein [Sphingomonas sp. CFBP 13706]
MSEATWGKAASPEIDWRMSAALENVPRGDKEFAEVTSLPEADTCSCCSIKPSATHAATLNGERGSPGSGPSREAR